MATAVPAWSEALEAKARKVAKIKPRKSKSKKAAWKLDGNMVQMAAAARLQSRNAAQTIEGGNIGAVERNGGEQIVLRLRNDNDDALPPFWRQWWMTKLDHVSTSRATKIRVENHGQYNYYLPVYSYDGVNFQAFTEAQVKKSKASALTIEKRFERPQVWLARWHPYGYTRLKSWLEGVAASPHAVVTRIGNTPKGRSIPALAISEFGRPLTGKRRVLLHARTHPGEVGSNFLLEGFVEAMLRDDALSRSMRQNLEVHIVPMLNVDGVVVGNNRVTPAGDNLEGLWLPKPGNELGLAAAAPREVKLLHAHWSKLASEGLQQGAPVIAAINLHTSAGEPRDQVFWFPHFGPARLGYNQREASLYEKQKRFMEHWREAQGAAWFNHAPADGTRMFLSKWMPENWWWRTYADKVMAVTVESVYGRAGPHRRWVEPEDMRAMGRSMFKALAAYCGIGTHGQWSNLVRER